MAAARRWVLFAIALASLVVMTYAGVLLAFSVPLTDEMLAANRDVSEAGRAVVIPVSDPGLVRTHAEDGEGVFLVASEERGSFPAGATGVTMRRALAYAHAGGGSNASTTLELVDVPSANGTSNLTIDVAALSGGAAGWIVMGSGEETPRFYPRDDVLGEVARFASGGTLGATFAAGFAGFVAPLVALIVTHKPTGRKGAPEGMCSECGGAMPRNTDFCLRCGAYRSGD